MRRRTGTYSLPSRVATSLQRRAYSSPYPTEHPWRGWHERLSRYMLVG